MPFCNWVAVLRLRNGELVVSEGTARMSPTWRNTPPGKRFVSARVLLMSCQIRYKGEFVPAVPIGSMIHGLKRVNGMNPLSSASVEEFVSATRPLSKADHAA